jgi:hypothetical protein
MCFPRGFAGAPFYSPLARGKQDKAPRPKAREYLDENAAHRDQGDRVFVNGIFCAAGQKLVGTLRASYFLFCAAGQKLVGTLRASYFLCGWSEISGNSKGLLFSVRLARNSLARHVQGSHVVAAEFTALLPCY